MQSSAETYRIEPRSGKDGNRGPRPTMGLTMGLTLGDHGDSIRGHIDDLFRTDAPGWLDGKIAMGYIFGDFGGSAVKPDWFAFEQRGVK